MDPNDGRVITNFIGQCLRGQKMTMYGLGQQTRSFCYVDDLIDGFVKIPWTSRDFTGPVNLGNPTEFTVFQLAVMIKRLIHGEHSIMMQDDYELLPLPQDDPKIRCPDISLARTALNWEPKVRIEEGLKRTIHYMRNELGVK